jgi:hypothetical protein
LARYSHRAFIDHCGRMEETLKPKIPCEAIEILRRDINP